VIPLHGRMDWIGLGGKGIFFNKRESFCSHVHLSLNLLVNVIVTLTQFSLIRMYRRGTYALGSRT
jgi:hypothetical protein